MVAQLGSAKLGHEVVVQLKVYSSHDNGERGRRKAVEGERKLSGADTGFTEREGRGIIAGAAVQDRHAMKNSLLKCL